jgi:hypothetical protein
MFEAKPQRPWLRFRLLTLVLMTLAAGPMLAMNLRDPQGPYVFVGGGGSPYEDVRENPQRRCWVWTAYQGWPIPVWEYYTVDGQSYGSYFFRICGPVIPIILNDMLIVAALFCVAFVSEFLICRREARKA